MGQNLNPKMYLTYDDVLIRPSHSEVLPHEVELRSSFSRNIKLNIPLVSAAMDTVTEAPTAIVLAQLGGIGVIHKNLEIADQAQEVEKVKKYESGLILNPITVRPEHTLAEVRQLTERKKITGVPVVNKDNVLEGILTSRDIQFEDDPNKKVSEVMTDKDKLVTAVEGVSIEEAMKLLHRHRIEKLPVVNSKGHLVGLITIKDIRRSIDYPQSNKDSLGRLRVAAAVGVAPKEFERAEALVQAQVDALVVDTAHGHSKAVIEMVAKLKKTFPQIDVLAGNVGTAEGAKALIDAGADGIKVGIGPGSICTTRVIAGIGVPQFSAVLECAEVCKKAGVPVIADGGVKYSGDVVKALAAGGSSVMIGSLFAGCEETPGETVLYQGRTYKVYRGMGSMGAMALGSKDRYAQANVTEQQKLVPEGIEGQVPYRGPLSTTIYQLMGGLRSGMGYVGAESIVKLQEKAEFIQISPASLRESHPHDVMVTKEAPNYQIQTR